jgi:hypothetical protein
MIVFVLCILAAFRIDQENQLSDTKQAFLIQCEQSNDLRKSLNKQGAVNKNFFIQAAESREAQAKIAEAKGLEAEAELNRTTAEGYRKSAAAYQPFSGIDCEKSYSTGQTIYIKI